MRSSEIRWRKLKLRLRDKCFANHKAPCTFIWQQPFQSVLALRGCSATDLIQSQEHGSSFSITCLTELPMLDILSCVSNTKSVQAIRCIPLYRCCLISYYVSLHKPSPVTRLTLQQGSSTFWVRGPIYIFHIILRAAVIADYKIIMDLLNIIIGAWAAHQVT